MKRPPVFLQNGGSCLSTIVLTISLIPLYEEDMVDTSGHFGCYLHVQLTCIAKNMCNIFLYAAIRFRYLYKKNIL